ncbi:MAG: MBL fold metallo-hydrolase [Verrucomicrobiae bacterium]|nr:MBL fold metallo-hydrolase [Verrucomicrobiae bacterium]
MPPLAAFTYNPSVPVQFTILGSGSTGNCAYLETDEVRLLIDAGFSGRQIRQRLASIERAPERLTGILITHEHSDHTQGLKILAAKLGIPVYCNRLTREAIERQISQPMDFQVFSTGSTFDIGDISVEAFSVPHDAYDPVGFLLHTGSGKIGFLTDLGHATKMIVERVRLANVLVLEANYDRQLLQDDTRRPWSTKQRIMSRHGHLSNDGAADVAEQIATDNLRHIFLGHLSSDCNDPELARRTVTERLEKAGITHISVQTASQTEPLPTLTLDGIPTP